jgi:Flp pilus assembly pilin Flp
MTTFIARLRSLVRDVDGQDLIEYALLASLVAIFSIAGLLDAGAEVDTLWNNIATGLANAVP